MTPIALVRRLSPNLQSGERTHIERIPIDLARAQEQHAHYVETLREGGATTKRVESYGPMPRLIDISEFHRAEGGLTCLSILLSPSARVVLILHSAAVEDETGLLPESLDLRIALGLRQRADLIDAARHGLVRLGVFLRRWRRGSAAGNQQGYDKFRRPHGGGRAMPRPAEIQASTSWALGRRS